MAAMAQAAGGLWAVRLGVLATGPLLLTGLAGAPARAAQEHSVQMLNKGSDGTPMVFEPRLVRMQPGDTVTFLPTDRGHNAETIKGMIPAGAEPFKGKINQPISVTLEVPGVYGIQCLPHVSMGMVALLVVGEPVNLEEAKAVRHRGKAKAQFEALFAELAAS